MKLVKVVHTISVSTIILLVLIVLFAFLSGDINHPEKMIQGTWKEIAWRYDKHDGIKGQSKVHSIELNDELKESISQGLHISQAETWVFDKNAQLTLRKKNKSNTTLNWRMKGRGHILALNYENAHKEYYQIQKLTHQEMVLYFENDTHARGIIQIVFKKVN